MTGAGHAAGADGEEERRTVPGANPRVVAYVLLNAGAILGAIGLALLTGRLGWGLVVLGVVLAAEGLMLVDVPRVSRPARPPTSQVRPRPGSPRVAFPPPMSAEPPPPPPAPRTGGPAGASTRD